MKSSLLLIAISFAISLQNLNAQCDFITPPPVKKIQAANREVTFSNVTMNGQKTTYLAVAKGETVKITTNVESQKNGDYCPSCIVQIYWGIHGHASVCAKSFYGYQFNRKKSKLQFEAPMKDGIYYVTMGSTLDYSCKNNKQRPSCSPDKAFAVLKVGNPDPETKITFQTKKVATTEYLVANLQKTGCFDGYDQITWAFNEQKIAEGKSEILLTQSGTYKVTWSGCLGSISESYTHTKGSQNTINIALEPAKPAKEQESIKKEMPVSIPAKAPMMTTKLVTGSNSNATKSDDISSQMENSDRFVMEHLIFDQAKAHIKPEAKMELNKLASYMIEHPTIKIRLEGHTDKRGNAKKNQELSEKRVEAAKKYLVKRGVSKDKVETIGYGDTKPLIVSDDLEKSSANRRVEVRILAR